MHRVLAFDIGIKNLAWCCFEKEGDSLRILGWDNYNLLSDESNLSESTTKQVCTNCSAKAKYMCGTSLRCARHCSPLAPPLRDCSGTLLKKVPTMAEIKQILEAKGLTNLPNKKGALEEELAKHFSLPIQVKKVSKAPDVGLTEIHNGIRKLVSQQKDLWNTSSLILLENQPVLKNPTMKSVQMLLFATLRCELKQPPSQIKLVHAGKKSKGAKKGDEGYKDRKSASEARVEEFFKNPNAKETQKWQTLWSKAGKKSDLADALSMCIDHA
jgi:hypothetical protein